MDYVQSSKRLKNSKLWTLFAAPLEEYRLPTKLWTIWTPAVTLGRHLIVAAAIAGLSGTGHL